MSTGGFVGSSIEGHYVLELLFKSPMNSICSVFAIQVTNKQHTFAVYPLFKLPKNSICFCIRYSNNTKICERLRRHELKLFYQHKRKHHVFVVLLFLSLLDSTAITLLLLL